LVYDVRRFRFVRDSVVFVMMVLFSIGLGGAFFFNLFCGGIVSSFFS
jgi:hypothetical protein